MKSPPDDVPGVYEAILFDMDGLLLRRHDEYPETYTDAVVEAFRSFDVEPTAADVEAFFRGSGKTLEGMREVCDRYGVDFETFWSERERQASNLQRRMMERGERELYDDCTVLSTLAESHDLGLVSNNQQETVEFALDYFGLTAHFGTAYGREPSVEGFERTKPDAYYVERALEDLGTRSALLVGDSASDVIAADRAGIDSAFVWRDHRSGYELSAEATHEMDRLTELTDGVANR